MNFTANQGRPVPRERDRIGLEELISLRHWPPARGKGRQRMGIREGHHLSPIRGRGMEFDDVREYQPGDDIRHLDWRLMARTGEAHTRLYREERERPVFVLTELRPGMHFATRGHYNSVLAAYAAALTVWTTLANDDRIGGHLLGGAGAQLFRPSGNRQQAMTLIAALAERCNQPPQPAEPEPGLVDALAQAERYLGSGTLVYLFSDFHDLSSAVQQHLLRLAQRCELKLVLLSDPLEEQLPQGRGYRFASAFGAGAGDVTLDLDPQRQASWAQRFQQRLALLEQLHQRRGVEVAHWRTDRHPLFRRPPRQGTAAGEGAR